MAWCTVHPLSKIFGNMIMILMIILFGTSYDRKSKTCQRGIAIKTSKDNTTFLRKKDKINMVIIITNHKSQQIMIELSIQWEYTNKVKEFERIYGFERKDRKMIKLKYIYIVCKIVGKGKKAFITRSMSKLSNKVIYSRENSFMIC